MADSPDPAVNSDTYSTPRWVKVFVIIALVIGLLVLILMFTRGQGGHSPARHFGGQRPASSVLADSDRGGKGPPEGSHR